MGLSDLFSGTVEILAELDPKDESSIQGGIHENMLGLAATGWAEVDRSVNGQPRISKKVLFSKICPSAGAHGAQKSCKSTALTKLDKRHDHFGKDAACAIAGLATLLPVVMLLLSSRPSRWSRARRALPLAAAVSGPPIFWVFAPIRVRVAVGANPCLPWLSNHGSVGWIYRHQVSSAALDLEWNENTPVPRLPPQLGPRL